MMSIAADDGTFTIGDVAPGTYRITAHANAGGALGGIGAVSFAVNVDGALSGQATITIGSADVTGLTSWPIANSVADQRPAPESRS
jgi:hypothetical protein